MRDHALHIIFSTSKISHYKTMVVVSVAIETKEVLSSYFSCSK